MNDDTITRNTASAGIPALPAIPAGEPPVSRDGVIRINLFYREHAEDAICTSDGVAAVADGMGGSGHIEHEMTADLVREIVRIISKSMDEHDIKHDKHRDMQGSGGHGAGRRVTEDTAGSRFLGMWNGYKSYLDSRGMVKDGTVTATSAALASRVVMALFEGKLDEWKRAGREIDKKFGEILHGIFTGKLQRIAGKKLLDCEQIGKRGDAQKLRALPTTFAAVIPEKKDGRIVAHVFWAGDSRCYALDGRGLHPLTTDEEDSGGSVTNYLTGESGIECRLNYRRYEFDTSPRAFLACSDGFFDMGDLRVPETKMVARLRDAVAGAESDSEASAKLAEQCRPEIGDDCTVSVITVTESGDGLTELGKLLESAGKKADKLMKKGDELAPARAYAQAGEEGMKKLRDQMIGRIVMKKDDFADKIASLGAPDGKGVVEMIVSFVSARRPENVYEDARELLENKGVRVVVTDGRNGADTKFEELIAKLRDEIARAAAERDVAIKRAEAAVDEAKSEEIDAREKYEEARLETEARYTSITLEHERTMTDEESLEKFTENRGLIASENDAKAKYDAATRKVRDAEAEFEERRSRADKEFEQAKNAAKSKLAGKLANCGYIIARGDALPVKECALWAIGKDPGRVVDILAEAGKLVEAGFNESYSERYLTLLRGKRSPEESAEELKKLGKEEAAFSAPYDRCEEQEVLRKKKH